jgi:hypothetical protein
LRASSNPSVLCYRIFAFRDEALTPLGSSRWNHGYSPCMLTTILGHLHDLSRRGSAHPRGMSRVDPGITTQDTYHWSQCRNKTPSVSRCPTSSRVHPSDASLWASVQIRHADERGSLARPYRRSKQSLARGVPGKIYRSISRLEARKLGFRPGVLKLLDEAQFGSVQRKTTNHTRTDLKRKTRHDTALAKRPSAGSHPMFGTNNAQSSSPYLSVGFPTSLVSTTNCQRQH